MPGPSLHPPPKHTYPPEPALLNPLSPSTPPPLVHPPPKDTTPPEPALLTPTPTPPEPALLHDRNLDVFAARLHRLHQRPDRQLDGVAPTRLNVRLLKELADLIMVECSQGGGRGGEGRRGEARGGEERQQV